MVARLLETFIFLKISIPEGDLFVSSLFGPLGSERLGKSRMEFVKTPRKCSQSKSWNFPLRYGRKSPSPGENAENLASRAFQGPTRKPRHASVFSTSTPTRKRFPHSTVHECFTALFRRASVFKTHRHAVYQCLKEVQKPFRHASVFRTRVSTRACPFLKRAFLLI